MKKKYTGKRFICFEKKVMIKKILTVIFLIVGISVIYLQHAISYDSRAVNILGKTYNLEDKFGNFYVKYFYLKNEDPIYVWKDKMFTDYQQKCFEKNENCLIIPNQQFYADILWLNSIQYVGTVLDSSQAPYLYPALENLTNVSPYWDYPYVFGELMIPIAKNANEEELGLTGNQKQDSWKNAVIIGKKGIKYTCDDSKVQEIKKMDNKTFFEAIQGKIINDTANKISLSEDNVYKKLKNPCRDGDTPSYLGFNNYYYLGDWQDSSDYYKVASFQEDVPPVAANMVSIVSGRSGQHIKSMQLWFTRFLTLFSKYQTLTQESEKKIYEDKTDEALKRGVFEYQLDILQQIDSTLSGNQCLHDYNCIVENGILKEKIFKEDNRCQQYNGIDMNSMMQISEDDAAYADKLKCLMLSYGTEKKYIFPKDGKFEYPLNDKQKEGEKFSFNYDSDLQDWWIAIKNF